MANERRYYLPALPFHPGTAPLVPEPDWPDDRLLIY